MMTARTSARVRMRRPAIARSFWSELSIAHATRSEVLARPSLHVAQVTGLSAIVIVTAVEVGVKAVLSASGLVERTALQRG